MSIIAGATMMGRKQAEARMTDTCVIRRKTGTTVDHSTGEEVPVYMQVYPVGDAAGICELKFPDAQTRTVSPEGQSLDLQQPVLKLPVVGSEGVTADDVFEITASAMDAGMVGVKGRIAGRHLREYATARRLPVEVYS